ncbi:MAG: hypothetical protein ACTHJ4_05865 [Candidatus Nucleicultricaceae bacterium]|jgi:hypothetical protein
MHKLKGVLDTPTLMAAALYDGVCRSILSDALTHHMVYISEDLIADYLTCVRQKTFESKRAYLQSFLKAYVACARVVQVKQSEISTTLPPHYQSIVDTVQPDFLVSTFSTDASIHHMGKTAILSPHDFSKVLAK